MKQEKGAVKTAIRYSEAFKMAVVRELETELVPAEQVRQKHGLGVGTIQEWLGKYGHGTRGKMIRVETPQEIDQLKKLKERSRRLETALADAHVDLVLERAYTRRACQRAGITDVEELKKDRWPAAHDGLAHKGGAYGVSVASVCRKVGMTRANDYARRRQRRRREVDQELVARLVQAERQQQPRLGTRKLQVLLKTPLAQAGVEVGRDRLFEILRERPMLLAPPAAASPSTTDSQHYLPVFKNEIKERTLTRPNQVWVSDVTCVRTREGFQYVALVTDRCSRKIVGYHCGETLAAAECVRALEMALAGLPAGEHPTHHSDRGSQYCCHEYVDRLVARGLGISMTGQNHGAENALAERMNGILKSEYGLGGELAGKAQARQAATQAVQMYNTRRPHGALEDRFPEEVHGRVG